MGPDPAAGSGSSTSTGSGSSGSSSEDSTDAGSETRGLGSSGGSSSGRGETDESSSSESGEPVEPDACTSVSELAPEELLSEIDTIVVVMMENRSFDHYFGSSTFEEGWTLDGLTGTESNLDLAGVPVPVYHLTNYEPEDPPHGWDAVHAQWNVGLNDGFVREHQQSAPASYTEVMGYHTRSDLSVLYQLAGAYTLCDRWFCSVLGPTWPNRFYMHAGSSNRQTANQPEVSLTHVWDVLDDAGLSGINYYSDLPWAWGGFIEPLASYTDPIDHFFADAQNGTLPNFSIIDPEFGLLGGGGSDDHPPHNIDLGEVFLASVYAALAQSPQWSRCLLVITYDEHGGFYDHVPPPTTTDSWPEFQVLGIRVPAVVIGPHVRRRCVVSHTFEHASVLATVGRRFGVQPPATRIAFSSDLSPCIDPATLRNPAAPAALQPMALSLTDLLAPRPGTGQSELAELIRRGELPLPREHQRVDPGYALKLRLVEHAQRLGVVHLRV